MKKGKRILPLLLLILLSVYFKPIPAAACSCMMPPSPDVALTEAAAVFSGEVVDVKKSKNDYGKTVQFQVNEIWKGIDSATVSVFTGNDSAGCGIDFIVGKEYLVYANTMDSNGKDILSTTLCDRTAELVNAADDLAIIGEGQIAVPSEQATDSQTNPYYLYAGILAVVAGLVGFFLWKRFKKS
ncbi:LPXTG cell wall anchor domain-containing protein [Sporosarcina sp. CAU 1771]